MITPRPDMPSFPIVIANPMVGVSTPVIFRNLANKANPRPCACRPPLRVRGLGRASEIGRNDLQQPAEALEPVISEVLHLLGSRPGALAVADVGFGSDLLCAVFEPRRGGGCAGSSRPHPAGLVCPCLDDGGHGPDRLTPEQTPLRRGRAPRPARFPPAAAWPAGGEIGERPAGGQRGDRLVARQDEAEFEPAGGPGDAGEPGAAEDGRGEKLTGRGRPPGNRPPPPPSRFAAARRARAPSPSGRGRAEGLHADRHRPPARSRPGRPAAPCRRWNRDRRG